MGDGGRDGGAVLNVAVQRARALSAFADRPHHRVELQDAVGVSRTTAHRIITSLTAHGLLERTTDGHALTPLGAIVAEEVASLHGTIDVAHALDPFISALVGTSFDVPLASFADATIINATPEDQYGPLARFATLLDGAEAVRGFDTDAVPPRYVEAVADRARGGARVDVVYPNTVAQRLVSTAGTDLADATSSGRFELSTAPNLPFGLTLFDDHLGLAAYDTETGVLVRTVDTDDPDAVAWGERLFYHYHEEATAFPVEKTGPHDD